MKIILFLILILLLIDHCSLRDRVKELERHVETLSAYNDEVWTEFLEIRSILDTLNTIPVPPAPEK